MPNDPQLAAAVVALLATYLLHSSLLLGAVWLALTVARASSAALHDRLWKLAALAPLCTAPLQLVAAERFADWSVWTLPAVTLPWERPASTRPVAREVEAPAGPIDEVDVPIATSRPDDGAAFVEIIPGPASVPTALDQELPLIEPAAPDLVAIEPADPPPGNPGALALDAPPVDRPSSPVAAYNRPAPVAAAEPASIPSADLKLGGAPFAQRRAWPNDANARPAVVHSSAVEHNRWRTPVSCAFAVLLLFGASRLVWRAVIAHRRLRRVEAIATGPLRIALDQLVNERRIARHVRLAQSVSALEPAAGGILRWTIVVPPGIADRLSPAELHALLAHELAHLVRRDPLWLWIGVALCWCLPIQPLNFLAVRRWRQASEELCDDWAIAGGVRPLTLANCLTHVAEWRLAPMPLGLTSDVGRSRFARRVSRLISGESNDDRWSRPARRRLVVAALLAGSVLLTLCGPRMQAGTSSNTAAVVWEGDAPAEPLQKSDVDSDSARREPRPPGSQTTSDNTQRSVVDDTRVAGAGPSAAREAPDDRAATSQDGDAAAPSPDPADSRTTSDEGADLESLLADLERVETLMGELGDDPEIDEVRNGLRQRLQTLRTRIKPDITPNQETADEH